MSLASFSLFSSYFRQTKWESFQRQCNIYGFQRICRGIDKGAYYHEYFLKNLPHLALYMKRIQLKGTGPRKPASVCEPDFYTMPSADEFLLSGGRLNSYGLPLQLCQVHTSQPASHGSSHREDTSFAPMQGQYQSPCRWQPRCLDQQTQPPQLNDATSAVPAAYPPNSFQESLGPFEPNPIQYPPEILPISFPFRQQQQGASVGLQDQDKGDSVGFENSGTRHVSVLLQMEVPIETWQGTLVPPENLSGSGISETTKN